MKYCANCGNEIKEGVKFCSKCGAEQVQSEQAGNTQPVQGAQTGNTQPVQGAQTWNTQQIREQAGTLKSKFMSDKRYKMAGIIVLGVILILILFKACSGSGSRTMEGAVETYYKAIVDKDGEDYLDIIFSDSMLKAVEKESDYTKKEMIEDLEEGLESKYDDFGKVKNIKVRDMQVAGSAQLEDLIEEIQDQTDVKVKISEMHQVEASFQYFDVDDKEWKEDEESLTVYKSGSRWYVLPSGMF